MANNPLGAYPGGFECILNFRDVGETVNGLLGKKVLKEGLLFRSARPDRASIHDRERLANQYKLNTVIDLRSKTEHISQANKHQETPILPALTLPPVQFLEAQYFPLDLNGSAFSKALLWQLSWANLAKLFWLYALGYRTDAVSILGRNVMSGRGLTGLACDTLRYSTSEIYSVFSILSRQANYPVLVHCTQGKDRTGLVILLVLSLLNIDQLAISSDYIRSEGELLPEREERMREIESLGLSEEFARCPKGFVERVQEFLIDSYGSVEGYLTGIGVEQDMQEKVLQILSSGERGLGP